MSPDTPKLQSAFSQMVDEQLELAAAKIPALEATAVHPSPLDHGEQPGPHANFEDLLLGNAEASPELLEELAALDAAPAFSDEELARQALADSDGDSDNDGDTRSDNPARAQ